MSTPILQAQGVTKRFGGLTAVSNFTLTLQPGEFVGLIGPNGAGKTTAFNLITGVYQPTEGSVHVAGAPTAGLTPDKITAKGIARTFQNIRLFQEMTVLDNIRTAFNLRVRYNLLHAMLRTGAWRRQEAEIEAESLRLLELFDLAALAQHRSASLAYGQQRRLEIARALATRPKLLLLDEPAAGMNPQEKEDLMHLLRRVQGEFDLTILLIEHDMKFVMQICQRILVLDYGKVIAEGTPSQIRVHPDVIAAYLGDAADGIELPAH